MIKATAANPYEDTVGAEQMPIPFPTALSSSSSLSPQTTDETLTSENWEIILNLCNKVQDEGE